MIYFGTIQLFYGHSMKTFKLEIERYATYYETATVEIEAENLEMAKLYAFSMAQDDEIEFDHDPEPSIEYKAYEYEN